MGVIILAGDDSEFRVGDYIVMHREMTCIPSAPGTTYILHTHANLQRTTSYNGLKSYRIVLLLS